MQTQNRFLDFAEQVMARHNGFGYAYDPVNMIFLEDGERAEQEQSVTRQNIVTNLYHIQNIKEENYLYQQNLTFLTQILEKRLYQRLYPTVEQQIEKAVREEMPEAEEKIVKSFSQQMYKLVERGGVEQFEVIRDRILSEYHEKENIVSKEQEILFRKIENIWNSSVYNNAVHKSLHQNTNYQMVVQPTQYTQMVLSEKKETVLEQAVAWMKTQEQRFIPEKTKSVGNQGLNYQPAVNTAKSSVSLEYMTEVSDSDVLTREEMQIREKEILRNEETLREQLIREEERNQKQMIYERERLEERVVREEVKKGQAQILQHISSQMIEPKIIQSITQNMSLNTQMNKEVQPVTVQTIIQNLRSADDSSWTDIHIRQDNLHLEYSNVEADQLNQEMIQLIQHEMSREPELPKVVLDRQEYSKETEISDITEIFHRQITENSQKFTERSKSIAEQILLRAENSGVISVETPLSAARTVAHQKMSQVILEYMQEQTSEEQLQERMADIIRTYQEQQVHQTNQLAETVFEKTPAGTIIFRSTGKQQMAKAPETVLNMEPAPIVYRSEEDQSSEKAEKTNELERQVKEVVRNLKTVEEKTIVQKESIIEEQRRVVREVLKSQPEVWTEGDGAAMIRKEVQQSMEEQINQNVNQIVNKVYRRLEDKLKTERGRRGLI